MTKPRSEQVDIPITHDPHCVDGMIYCDKRGRVFDEPKRCFYCIVEAQKKTPINPTNPIN